MVEDIEERVLRTRTDKILNIIDNQHIYLHIERQEVSKFVLHVSGVHILCLELASGNIEYNLIRIFLLDSQTDSL